MNASYRLWDKQDKRMITFCGDGWHLSYQNGSFGVYYNSINQCHGGKLEDRFVLLRGIEATMEDGKVIPPTPQLDVNGKQIFSGDIVLTDEAGWVAQVVWTGDQFMCLNGGWSMCCNWGSFKVLGNIYENPDLVKEHNICIY